MNYKSIFGVAVVLATVWLVCRMVREYRTMKAWGFIDGVDWRAISLLGASVPAVAFVFLDSFYLGGRYERTSIWIMVALVTGCQTIINRDRNRRLDKLERKFELMKHDLESVLPVPSNDDIIARYRG